ncbi:MAG: hydratase [Oscillospiraceae bacterium]|nr:hydratase [Oscillospiraceae bacterium]
MIQLHEKGVYLVDGAVQDTAAVSPEEARRGTMAWRILQAHNTTGDERQLRVRFDAMVSHDITYVGIIQQARASGMKSFPLPYALTNCHNSLCAVGGTINEDDHQFGLSAAKKYGGIYVPANQSVIHSYARECLTRCGGMVLGSDSHTRYGALGTMAVGEGGPELCKQLLKNTWDVPMPQVVLVYLTGKPRRGVGPHDVALSLVKATFQSKFVNNKVLEFVGPGIAELPIDFRNGIDVMTTETTCLSSIWETDEVTRGFYEAHGRGGDYAPLHPASTAYYDAMITVELDKVEPMIALPFHPSNAYTIRQFLADAPALLRAVEEDARRRYPKADVRLLDKCRDGGVWADQGVIAGCSGGLFDNITESADILRGCYTGADVFSLAVYPTSVPVSLELMNTGATAELLRAGAVIKPSFCGPCFGAGDVPANNGLSLRHTTRNFPNREGSKPGEGQFAAVCLMDARSIAATARNGGRITPADEVDYTPVVHPYHFDASVYAHRVYNGFGRPDPSAELVMGPNITDWPKMYALTDHLLVELAAVIHDSVTTTDELIPSGETSSYRSNPLRLAEFTLSRRVPDYVDHAKAVAAEESLRREGAAPERLVKLLARVGDAGELVKTTQFGSAVFANRPGDGSAREQAASCQKVLGGFANICYEFATKRYRSNCINWGILPFTLDADTPFPYESGDCVFVPHIRRAVAEGMEDIPAVVLRKDGTAAELTLHIRGLTAPEREILLDGCLMNYYAAQAEE